MAVGVAVGGNGVDVAVEGKGVGVFGTRLGVRIIVAGVSVNAGVDPNLSCSVFVDETTSSSTTCALRLLHPNNIEAKMTTSNNFFKINSPG